MKERAGQTVRNGVRIGMEKLRITALTTSIGAQVSGVDFRQEVSGEMRARISEALSEHLVLVFKGQQIGLDEQYRVAEIFGPLEPLPSLKFFGGAHDDAAVTLEPQHITRPDRPPEWNDQLMEHQGWHTDSSFTEFVPRAAVLRAEVISPVGGGTCWANMCAAFEGLSPTMQNLLMDLKAIHWLPPSYKAAINFDAFPKEMQERFDKEFAPREHPVVIDHPLNGRKALFVNPTYTMAIAGMKPKESRTLLRMLFDISTLPDYVYRHRWDPGDIAIWDELATMHLAPNDFAPHPRRMVRVTAGRSYPHSQSNALGRSEARAWAGRPT